MNDCMKCGRRRTLVLGGKQYSVCSKGLMPDLTADKLIDNPVRLTDCASYRQRGAAQQEEERKDGCFYCNEHRKELIFGKIEGEK